MLVIPEWASRDAQTNFGPKLTEAERVAIYCLYHARRVRPSVLAATFNVHRLTIRVMVSKGTKSKYPRMRDTIDAMGLDEATRQYVTPAIEERVQTTLDRMHTARQSSDTIPTLDKVKGPDRRAKRDEGTHLVDTNKGPLRVHVAYLDKSDERNPVSKSGWFFRVDHRTYWEIPPILSDPARTSTEVLKALVEEPPYILNSEL